MGNTSSAIPSGTTVTNAYTIGSKLTQYVDENGVVQWGYPAYGASGAQIGYARQQTLGETDYRSYVGVQPGSQEAVNAQSRATTEVTPAIPVPTPTPTPTTSSDQQSTDVAAGTTGTGTYTDVQKAPARPAFVQPKIETIDGKEVVTIEGGSLNRMLRDFYSAGQFAAAAEMNQDAPKNTTQYSPATGRQIVQYADPTTNNTAQQQAADLKQAYPAKTDAQIFEALKSPNVNYKSTPTSAIDRLKGQRM